LNKGGGKIFLIGDTKYSALNWYKSIQIENESPYGPDLRSKLYLQRRVNNY